MIITTYDSKNYIYIASSLDKYEYIIYIADTMQELADLFNLNISSICRMFNRHNDSSDVRYYKNYKIERIRVYDYAYIIFKDNIAEPLYISRDLKKLAKLANVHVGTLNKAVRGNFLVFNKEYQVKRIDLLELEPELAQYLEKCIDKKEIIIKNAPKI